MAFWCTFCVNISEFFSTFAANMRNLPTMTRYLLIANVIIYFLGAVFERNGVDLISSCGLFYAGSYWFHWWQPLTYMFLHANFGHLFFNMFALWMFAPAIENEWGTRRFTIYYLVCGLGAALVQELVWMAMGAGVGTMAVTIGASGAVFGILFAFGWLFPNVPMFLLFIPIPIRARVFVIIYAAIELMEALQSAAGHSVDNIAHFAHLGGFLFGWLFILYWRKVNWREPLIFTWWKGLKGRFSRSDEDNTRGKDFDNYHYHKRV